MATQTSRPESVVHAKCQAYLKFALNALGVPEDEAYQRNLATLILRPMLGSWRFFHNFDHVLAVGGRTDPIAMLAGIFHDLVYVQVDIGIPFKLTSFLNRVVRERDGAMRVRCHLPQDNSLQMLLEVFGLEPGQALNPIQGQNEFLSALVAVKALKSVLSIQHQLAIAVCIEATIPFRLSLKHGLVEGSHGLPEVTLIRLRQICQRYEINVSEAELVAMVRRSVQVANRDLLSFAQPSAASFLADIWNFLPEKNHQLSPEGIYRVKDYRLSIERTESFFTQVDVRSIFRSFRNEPSKEVYELWQVQAAKNLAVGRLYLSWKLVAIALIEAIAEPFGEQVTIELFMGALPCSEGEVASMRLEQFLPPVQWLGSPLLELESEVWRILSQGRAASRHKADLLYSPLATFLVQCHGFESLSQLRQATKSWLSQQLSTAEFLRQFDPRCLNVLYEAISRMWDDRQQLLQHHFYSQVKTIKSRLV